MSQYEQFEKLKLRLMTDLRAQLTELECYSFADVSNATKRIQLTEIRCKVVTNSIDFVDFITRCLINNASSA